MSFCGGVRLTTVSNLRHIYRLILAFDTPSLFFSRVIFIGTWYALCFIRDIASSRGGETMKSKSELRLAATADLQCKKESQENWTARGGSPG
jgi:hypothetical protein